MEDGQASAGCVGKTTISTTICVEEMAAAVAEVSEAPGRVFAAGSVEELVVAAEGR